MQGPSSIEVGKRGLWAAQLARRDAGLSGSAL
jgi:hypothetical protein